MYELGMIFGKSFELGLKPNFYENADLALYWYYQSYLNDNSRAVEIRIHMRAILQNQNKTLSDSLLAEWQKDYKNNCYRTNKRYVPDETKYKVYGT